jgi:hypothetical protein
MLSMMMFDVQFCYDFFTAMRPLMSSKKIISVILTSSSALVFRIQSSFRHLL